MLATPKVASPAARAIRDFSLFAHRKLADDLVLGEGLYLENLLGLLDGCAERDKKIAWLRQVARETADTEPFADRIARSHELANSCPRPALPAAPVRVLPAQAMQHDATWLALMHYRADGAGSWQSQADRPQFFLSKTGRHSPQDELAANLEAIKSPSYACTFPARYEWLNSRYKLALPTVVSEDCADFKAWYARFPGQRISISFASSYLENPSSMFGHTFLKVFQGSNRELLAPTINYAARTDARVSDLEFAKKGLFGGFPGVADELPFYRRLRTYTENEGRDIWEYELKLTPAEIRQLLLHLWEVRDGIFDYYFIDENCAYRTLALLDVARPDLGLLRQYTRVTAPVDTIRSLQASGLAGTPTLWPAFPKLVRQHERQLAAADVALAVRLASGAQSPASISDIDTARQAAILQLAYEYLSVLINRDQADRETRKGTMNAILRSRMALNSATTLATSVPSTAPENGHDSSPLSFGRYGSRERRGFSLAWAGFQHTLTDRLAGYEAHAQVTVLRAEIQVDAGSSARLESLDWLAIQSTLPASALFARPAWSLRLATARNDFEDGRHVTTSMAYRSGRAWALGDTVLALMPGISVEAGAALPHTAGAAGSMSMLVSRQSTNWSAQLELNAEKFFLGSHLYRNSARLTTSFALSRNVALDFSARRSFHPRPVTQAGVALKVYFRPLAFLDQ